MNSERFWVVVLCATVFCAGLAAGVLLSFRRIPPQPAGPFSDYETRMIETFGLDDEHVRNLRWILDRYQEDIDLLKDRNLAAFEPDLQRIGRYCREQIRSYVVPEHRRQEFDLWAGGLPARSTAGEPQ